MRVAVSARVDAAPEAIWATLREPRSLRRWWPRASRVEVDGPDAFTLVLMTKAGRPVRADYTVVARDERERWLRWRQELEGSPFERFLASAETVLSVDADGTVTLEAIESPRGVLATLGTALLRRGARRGRREALDALAELLRDGG